MIEPEASSSPTSWELRQHYHCRACGWIGPTTDYPEALERCPCCGAKPDGSEPFAEGIYHRPKHGWTCFHCGETFSTPGLAAEHFGASPDAEPGCLIKVRPGEERGLLHSLRAAELELARYRAEDTDLHRQIAAMACDHGAALRREEEVGYARGLRDAAVEHDRRVAELLAANNREVERRRAAEAAAANWQRATIGAVKLALADFYTPAEVETWLASPQVLLGGRSVANLLGDGEADRVLRLIVQLREGSYL